eukprot:XP_003723338.1 PREDICTED: uncharacterized protein LOC100891124 [Strongylocentrotus purpuratus]
MNDTLATINVEQLSSAVNAVVQSTAIGQVPLDPSPPPAAGVPRSHQEGGSLTLPHGGTTQMVQPCTTHCGRPTGLRTAVPVPTEMSIPVTAVPSPPVTGSLPTTHQPATLPILHTQTVPPSGPVVLVPNAGVQAGQRMALLQHSTLNIQPQVPAKKLYTLKQIGSNWVLVPTQSQPAPVPAFINNAGLLKPVTGNPETVVYQSSTGIIQGTHINATQPVSSQRSNSSSLTRQQPPHVNMNIAIHLPNNGLAHPASGVTQVNRCGQQPAHPPIRTQTSQDSAHLLSQICNLITSTASPASVVQPAQTNPPQQIMIVPNQLGSSQLQSQPFTPQVTSLSSQFNVLPSGGQSGQSEAMPLASSTSISVPSVLTNSISNINLFSPPLNFGSQTQLLSPLTSQKGFHDNNSFSGFTNSMDLQPALLNQGPDVFNLQPQQVSPGLVKLSSLPSLITPPQERSRVMTCGVGVKSSGGIVQHNINHEVKKQQESWCSSCKSIVKCCPHQKPSVMVLDKVVETRARQSLPDLLMFKPSSVIPGETGVFAKHEIQMNTRFGPVVGKLADINSSTDLDAIGQKAWRIFSDGKLCQLLFTNDESCSNWMMFIKIAKKHNLMAFQSGAHIYFTSFQNILPGEELIVWYSKEYGRLRGIKDRKGTLDCQKCDRSFLDKTQLRHHLKEAHPSLRCPDKMHKCNVCSHVFSSSSKLRTHLLTHLGVKPHRCKICHKGFTDRSNLRAHSLIHTGVKQFTCQACNKSFRQKIHLVSHQVTHTGKRDLQCFVCEKMFARHSDLSYHMKQHREVKKVSCPVCDRRFYKDSQLMRHMKIHSGQRDHQCHLCGKGFITKYHLSRHLKSCERYERFRRKPWPGSNSLDSMTGVVSSTSDERHLVRPMAPEEAVEQQEYIPARRRHQMEEVQEATSSRVLRSSRGRPIRPKPVPTYMAELVSPPSRGQGSAKRKKRVPRKVSRLPDADADSGSMATHTVSVTLYEVQSDSSQAIGQAIGQQTSSLRRLVHDTISEETKETIPSDHSASITVYGVRGEETEGSTDPSTDQQQPCSTLSQLAISVPQESPIVLDCDNFVSSSSVTRSHLESSYPYTSSDTPGDDEIHDGSLTTPLFDLGESPSMSSAVQSMPAYNSQSFSLEEEDDSHSDAFAGSQEHCSSARSLFMTDAAISDSVARSSSQSLDHQTHVDSLAEDNHADAFSGGSREHCPSSQSLFMTDSTMPDSVASTSSQSLGHQAHGSSLAEDSLFSMDPSDEAGTSLPQHAGDSMNDIGVDLRAIERVLDSDDEEQCTDERRGDSPSENIEE